MQQGSEKRKKNNEPSTFEIKKQNYAKIKSETAHLLSLDISWNQELTTFWLAVFSPKSYWLPQFINGKVRNEKPQRL